MSEIINPAINVRTADILGFSISTLGVKEIIDVCWKIVKERKIGNYVACANPHSLMVAEDDPEFSKALKSANLLLPDGIGILLAGKFLGRRFEERVAGMEFFEGLSARSNSEGGISYFFLGSSADVLEAICKRLSSDYPMIRVAGVLAPPYKDSFNEEENKIIINTINKASPNVLWVGMTAPKQEKWIYQNRMYLNVPLTGAIGAVFDFYAGTKKRSPKWLCQIGLEWLPRFLREPRRLWRRNLISSPKFIMRILLSIVK